MDNLLIFEKSSPGRVGYSCRSRTCPSARLTSLSPDGAYPGYPPKLPELSEPEAVRHYTNLSLKNFSVDGNFYPLGSCTMKYNPKVNDDAASNTVTGSSK